MKPKLKASARRADARDDLASNSEGSEAIAAANGRNVEDGSFLSCLARPGLITGDDSPQIA